MVLSTVCYTTRMDRPLIAHQWIPPRRYLGLASNLLMRASHRGKVIVSEALNGIGLSKYHYAVLAALEDDAPLSQADLSRRTGIDRSDIVAIVNELEGRSAIERMTDPADRRRNLVTMTAAGVDLLGELQRIIDAAQEDLLLHLDAEQREQLTRLLQLTLGEPENPAD